MTAGDPRGIGPEVVAAALGRPELREAARWRVLGPEGMALPAGVELEAVGAWPAGRVAAGARAAGPRAIGPVETGDEAADARAGALAARAVERAVELALAGEADGIVTAPLSKRALAAAGWNVPGHTELLRERTGVGEVTMMMAAETTPLGGPLRMALLTGHLPLREVPARLTRELALARSRIAVRALRDWWGMDRPRICLAGLNPHASEGGLFGDEEARVLEPVARELAEDGEAEVAGVVPADTAFRRCTDGDVDLVVVPVHDVGLAVIKTLARDTGVNVTAGLPFPRTAPDHGTAFDIAGRGVADPGATIAAMELCLRFCRAARGARAAGEVEA